MKVGASLNAKGWGMISEGLTMLETATAGADIPQLWSLLEAFFGKVDKDDASVTSAPCYWSPHYLWNCLMQTCRGKC